MSDTAFTPKGLTIYVEMVRTPLGPRPRYSASVKARGRTGARIRSIFTRLPAERQQLALAAWAKGHGFNLSRARGEPENHSG